MKPVIDLLEQRLCAVFSRWAGAAIAASFALRSGRSAGDGVRPPRRAIGQLDDNATVAVVADVGDAPTVPARLAGLAVGSGQTVDAVTSILTGCAVFSILAVLTGLAGGNAVNEGFEGDKILANFAGTHLGAGTWEIGVEGHGVPL